MAELKLQHLDKIYDNKVQAVFDFNMDVKRAKKILAESKIQTSFSPEHAVVLLNMVSGLKMPEEKEKALAFLVSANMIDPSNKAVENKLKEIQKLK